ncbi:hypothetical protein N7468_006561 [Penicillium chermesinum]|uniref:DUF1907 domain-containing protein n=1 Tax=Penicillium chermesinum TaxID=63820 RepID=A0A9W9TJR5_9EURO|nr:uncharacterized protein N7468_006561 [Penicillium chermesinum]KAJ5225336.1 hypothetical protein N7468_006561 [Penicillium chermesinum]KAJ6161438.1 hypothetical protein N7470_004834 [Penicillium chermesinum]
MSVTTHPRETPDLTELATVIQTSLQSNFTHATAIVAQCPDLRQPPFNLAAPGLSGNAKVADIGGQPNLFPQPNMEAKYSMLSIAKDMQMSSRKGFLIGAGAAPWQDIGHNAELAPNFSWTSESQNWNLEDPGSLQLQNNTHVTEVKEDGSSACHSLASTNCALMMNLYGSEGISGPVIKITARARTGEGNFTNVIRDGLRAHYGEDKPISLGGVFLLKSGKAKFHVMPDFPRPEDLPFRDRKQLENEWIRYYLFEAPVVCLTVFHSADPENLGLRMEHTHCFETEGARKGGHYHYDVDGGQEVEYEAYLHPASTLYRIDPPY